MSYFSAVFRANTEESLLISPLYNGPKKRKRQSSLISTDKYESATLSVEATHISPQCQSTPRTNTVLRGDDAPTAYFQDTEQRRQHFVDGIYSPKELRQELTFLKPPLAYPTITGRIIPLDGPRSGLKQRHLAVLTTIMHKCLAQGDYMRAGRAWGMLLRAEVKGHPQNIRSNGLWGLSAELLLQRGTHTEQHENLQRNHYEDLEAPDHGRGKTDFNKVIKTQFSRESFEDAKAYYERLVLQFPWRKWLPDALTSLHFYPVMFGLWISFIQDQHFSALSRAAPDFEGSSENDSLSEHSGSGARSTERQNIRHSSLQFSQAIAERLDELLLSFPYSDSYALWKLRAMVALWMADLSTAEAGLDQQVEEEASENIGVQPSDQRDESSSSHDRPVAAKNAQDTGSEESRKYLEKAKSAFETAENLNEQPRFRNELNGKE